MRLVCLSAEAADILYRIGAWDLVVGVTAFAPADLPPRPRVSGFSTGKIEWILDARPDLVITFSDVQAGLAAALIGSGVPVLALNHRTLSGVWEAIRLLGAVTARLAAAADLIAATRAEIERWRYRPANRPRIYFEEWPDPMISGIEWVDEIVRLAGGDPVFGSAGKRRASDRVVLTADLQRAQPDIILASWCGKKVAIEEIARRDGWQEIPAVRHRQIFEVDSNKILQAGPRLVEGLKTIREIVEQWNSH
jgi:iron complex transport system substrate-binding protein